MTTFNGVWSWLQSNLKPEQVIKNWTAFGGYLGDTMKIGGVRNGYIEVDAPYANCIQVISKEDFEKVWEIWPVYKGGKFPRYQIRDMTRFSKYIISILNWMEQKEEKKIVEGG